MHPEEWTPAQKTRLIVGLVVAGILACAGLVYGYQLYQRGKPKEGVQRIEDLGFGFRRVTVAKFNKGELVHYPFFYYKDRLLCQISAPPSISPSGNFAVYQDPKSGKIMLFRRQDEKITSLTATAIGIPSQFVWHENDGNVEAVLGKDGMSAVFSLQPAAP